MTEETVTEELAHGEAHEEAEAWTGGDLPFKVKYGKLMMWYFLVSDAFTFSAFLIAYGTTRISQPWWPDPNKVFNAFPGLHGVEAPMMFVSVMTFILIMSSVFVVRAVQEGQRMNKKGVMFWMVWGIVGGLAFLGCQTLEWTHLIHQGLTPSFNPFGPDANGITSLHNAVEPGPPAFGALFFGITGFHGFHVFSGVCFNIWGLIATANGTFERQGNYDMIEKLGLYWHFVDLVWVFVFLCFYLL